MPVLNLYNCLTTYLIIGALLFSFGVYGLLVPRTVVGMLISAEFVVAAASTNLMPFSRFVARDPRRGRHRHQHHDSRLSELQVHRHRRSC